ncbi:MAG TPA: protein kinase, partial [Gemmataceae bacterium]|nr:protein kinase [Gemmataceae bacterium]
MSDEPVASVEQQLRQACTELDRRLRRGEPCRAEHLFASLPNLAHAEESALELIYTEFVIREELGEQVSAGEFFRRFPQWHDALVRQFEVHAALHDTNLSRASPTAPTETPLEEASSPAALVLPPKQIGPYEIIREVGRGAMGVVYQAQHRLLRRTVALKMVLASTHTGATALTRFQTEAEAAARLHHPNIVQVYDVGTFEGRPYLALEYIEGGSLAAQLTGQPQQPRQAAQLLHTLATAVAYAHRRGVVHRDLKPGNVLLEEHSRAAKISDFGLAKVLDRPGSPTESGVIFGTPSYMAPEQAAGQNREVGAAADVYALGAILYELLTGRPPFRAENVLTTLQQVASEEPVPPERLQADLPRDLATICLKCLEKDPGQRYVSAAALAADLRRFLDGEPIVARPSNLWQRGWKWARRRPSLAALVGTLSLAAVALLIISLWYNALLRAALDQSDQRGSEAQQATIDALRERHEAEDKGRHLQAAVEKLRRQSIEHQAVIEDLRRHRSALQTAYEKIEQKNSEARAAMAESRRREAETRRQAQLLARQTSQLQHQVDYTRQLLYTAQISQVEATWGTDPTRALALLEDNERCPPELRDFAWGMFHHLCKQDHVLVTAHTDEVQAIAYAPRGDILATAGGDDTIELWNGRTFRLRKILTGHDAPVTCLKFSPDGHMLASGSEDHTVRLWDVPSGRVIGLLTGHAGTVDALAFTTDGQTLAAGAADGSIRVWDVPTGKPVTTLTGHAAAVQALHFSAKGDLLTSASSDRTVRIWDLATLDSDQERSRFSMDLPATVTALALSADGKWLAAAGREPATLELFELHATALVHKHTLRGHVDRIRTIAFSEDGRLLATAGDDQTIRLWEVATGSLRDTLTGHRATIHSVAFAPDGRSVTSAGEGTDVHIWSLPTRLPDLFRPAGKAPARIVALALSPSGKLLATGGYVDRVELRDAHTLKRLARLPGPGSTVWALAFASDNRMLAVAGEDGTVQLWDVDHRRRLASWAAHRQRLRAVRFSPDGHTLATA